MISSISTSKRWLLYFPFVLLGVALSVYILIVLIIDPYAEYNLFGRGKKYFAESHTSPVLIAQKLKTNAYALVFGTSRSNNISTHFLGKPTLNFSSSLYGNPDGVYFFLSHLTAEQRNHIKEIYYLLDLACLRESSYDTDPSGFTFNYFMQTILNFNRWKVMRTISTAARNLFNRSGYYIDETGSVITQHFSDFHPSEPYLVKHSFPCSKSALEKLYKIDQFCKQYGIRITYFMDTFSMYCLRNLNKSCLEAFLKGIAHTVEKVYAPIYLDAYAKEPKYFYNSDHHKDELTAVVCSIVKERQEEYAVSAENVDQYWEELESKIE